MSANHMKSIILIIGLISRIVFWIGLVYIVGHAVVYSYQIHDYGMSILKLVFFPLTYFIHPWTAGLQSIFIISLVSYWISTFLGGLEPVD